MLLGLITLYFLQPEGNGSQYGTVTGRTFDMTVLFSNASAYNMGDNVFLGKDMQYILFAMLMIGFLVKLPAVPFHTWLPDAHVQAPTCLLYTSPSPRD